jgi:hypothetical protein
MLYLDTTEKALGFSLSMPQATNQIPFVCSWSSILNGQTTFSSSDGLSKGLNFVTAIHAPESNQVSKLEFLSIENTDTSPTIVTIQMISGITQSESEYNTRNIFKAYLGVGYSLIYDSEEGFTVYDATGAAVVPQPLTNVNNFSTASGVNTYTNDTALLVTSYVQGLLVRILFKNTNTGASTININGLGAIALKKNGGVDALQNGDIIAGSMYDLQYDGSNFQIVINTAI